MCRHLTSNITVRSDCTEPRGSTALIQRCRRVRVGSIVARLPSEYLQLTIPHLSRPSTLRRAPRAAAPLFNGLGSRGLRQPHVLCMRCNAQILQQHSHRNEVTIAEWDSVHVDR